MTPIAAEGPFFGYNGEMQDAATGLVYMRARHYDAASGRFGSADSVLGSLADPLSLNRYLYCGADPVNFVGPTGHASRTLRLSRGKPAAVNLRGIAPKRKLTSWDAGAKSGQANVSQVWRGFNMLSGALQMHTTAYGARKAAWANAVKLIGEAADRIEARYGWASRGLYSKKMAEINRVHVLQYYCGNASHLNDFAGGMHAFAQDYWYVPVAGTLADWCAYVAEGNVEMTVLYGALGLADVLGAGSVGSLKTGLAAAIKQGKFAVGAGIESMKRADSLVFSSANKTASKLAGQMEARGWTKADVKNVVMDPFTTRKSTYKGEGQNSLTVYYEKDGSHVIADDVTNEVIQISERGDPDWKPDNSIIDPYIPG